MKKLTKKKKIKIIKIFLETYGVLMLAYMGYMLYLDILAHGSYDSFYYGALIGLVIVIVIYMVLYYTFGFYVENSTNFKHSYQYDFNYQNFEELNADIQTKLLKQKYNLPVRYEIGDKEEIYIYLKPIEDKNVEMWIVSNLISVTKDKVNKITKVLENFLIKNFSNEKIKVKKSIHLVCVKRYSMEFESLVKDTFISHNPVMTFGLSFSKRKIYIPTAKEVYATITDNYDYLKAEFLKIVDTCNHK